MARLVFMRKPMPLVVALIERITPTNTGCYEWTQARSADGYGRWVVDGREWRAHRKAYELFVGPIPGDMEIDHLCKNRACCNPFHLEAVDRRTNMGRSDSPSTKNSRKTHCLRGHEFTPENTVMRKNGHRDCRVCRDARNRAWQEANRGRIRVKERERMRRWRAENPEKAREMGRESMRRVRERRRGQEPPTDV